MEKYDVVVIGGGPGGLDAGFRLVKAGKRVCIVQDKKESLGGVCLNAGCMPTKSFLKAASVYRYAKKAEMFGLKVEAESVNLAKVKASVNEGIAKLRGGVTMMSENSGAEFKFGIGSFISGKEVLVTKADGSTETVYGNKIVIAAGSVSRELPFAPFDGEVVMNSDMMLENEKLPERLLIIGGGAIGCEFATMYNTFGSKVKVVEALSQLIPNDDSDASAMLKERFQGEGIDVSVDTMLESLNVDKGVAKVRFKDQQEEEIYDMVLVSIGRKPNIDGLNLENAGVERTGDAVKVNEYLQTSNPDIYGAGDSIGGWMFAHSAAYEGEVCAANILKNNTMSLDERAVPRVVFTSPEMASVGLVKADDNIKVLHIPGLMKGRPITDKTPVGMFKLFVFKESDEIAGGVILGDCATEIIHELVMAVQNRLTVKQLKQTMHAHPTFAEPLSYLAMSGM